MPSRPSPNAQAVEFPGKMSDGNQVGGDRFCGLANHGGRSLAPKKEAVSGKASRDQQRREKQDRAVWHGGGDHPDIAWGFGEAAWTCNLCRRYSELALSVDGVLCLLSQP